MTTAGSQLVRRASAAPSVPLRARAVGLGSIFGKTLRDSRVAMLVVVSLLGVMILAGGEVMSTTYGAPETRLELAAMSRELPPMMRGFYGNPVNVDTMGGFISWHYGSYFALLTGLWSILALSSTLATEARRGSLDLAVATPRSRRGVALQKVAGHVVAVAIVVAVLGGVAWVTGAAFATMPRDEITVPMAASFAVGLAVRALVAGSVAFALASLVGRGAAAGIAGAVMVGGYVVYGYRTVVPAFDTIAGLTWWSWAADHIPLAGSDGWAGIAMTIVIAVVLLAAGVEIFVRRDVGVTMTIPVPGLPATLLGVRGPVGRALGDMLPAAWWWSVGLGIYAALMSVAAGSLLDLLAGSPGLAEVFRTLIPGIDVTKAAGFLQLAFVDLGLVLFGLVAATFVASRWADETEGRLELLLATPLSRARWALSAGVAACLAVAAVTAVVAITIGLGVASMDEDPVGTALGTLVLGCYAVAMTGIGMAVGGLVRPSAATPAVLAVVVGTFLLDTLAPILRLPDWVAQLALTTHLGEPLTGAWDPAGTAACIILAVGGIGAGTLGMARRDVRG